MLKIFLKKIQLKSPWFFYLIYDLVFITGLTFYLPVYFWRKKINLTALKQKLGFIQALKANESIWIQVVSVGEVNLIEGFLKRLKEVFDCPILISTTTLTGNILACKKYSHLAKIIFLPFDLSYVVKRVISKVKPKLFIAVETEIWPNLYRHLSSKNIPIVIVNGRISDKAFKRYKAVRELFKPILNNCFAIGAQNQEYYKKFIYLGADKKIVRVTGNMKFEAFNVNEKKLINIKFNYSPILKPGERFLFAAASTHEPEEEALIDIYESIKERGFNMALLLAPRHPQRAAVIEKLISAKGFTPVRISEIKNTTYSEDSVFILDTIGDLIYFLSLSDFCFVGGSFSNSGGHNILEPVYFLKPTLFGPDMSNFLDIEKTVLEMDAGIKVLTYKELQDNIEKLLTDEGSRKTLQSNCAKVFENEKNSLDSNLGLILDALMQKPVCWHSYQANKLQLFLDRRLCLGLKKWYLDFIERDRKPFLLIPLNWFFIFLSGVYWLAVILRNFLYEKGVLKSGKSKSKVISIGNISWSGSGKTPVSIWLYNKLSKIKRAAILRRGYGEDENELIKEHIENVFTQVNRLALAKEKENLFDVFILDDGFQHRKLKRDVDIVIMGAREFRKRQRLIPAYIFREPLSSLKRADVVIINHVNEINDFLPLRQLITQINPETKIFACQYHIKKFTDFKGRSYNLEHFRGKNIAAFTAIGYPQGFFNKLKAAGMNLKKELAYPDHYELSPQEYKSLESGLLDEGLKDLVITHKDKFHLPKTEYGLNIYIMEISLVFDDEDCLLETIYKKINGL
ncbi:MAG: tetraacyldisaccharide 4'-kinase [Candidatus Omnitrophica bacterium]|nr:tetraacyldisaccharide 4'-kinase [Candidatus Omnitrophota bacterium]